MSIAQIKKHLQERIDIADERLLKMMYVMMEAYYDDTEGEQAYDIQGKAQVASELRAELEQELAAAKTGKYIRLEALKQKSEKWLNNTK